MSTERRPDDIRREIERRRTFAIISHPDAGKTTLTEKLLLYGGAVREAGAVPATIGVLEMINQRVLARAYIQGDAILVVGLHYTRLPIAAIVGYLMFGDVPEIWIWVGGTVIAMAALFLARSEMQTANKTGPA